jgi:hypothetical protein
MESETKDVTLDSHPRLIVNGREFDGTVKVGDRATVRLLNRFDRGQIFYTTNGTQPSVTSQKYTGEFVVDRSVVLRDLYLNEELTETLELPPVPLQVVPSFLLKSSVTGQGRVECSPQQDRYLQDQVVQIRAIPVDGWRLVRWEGDLSGSGLQAPLTITAARAVHAVFEPIPRHALIVEARGGSVTGGGTYFQSVKVNLKAIATHGWEFLGWSGDHVGLEPNLSWEVKSPAHFVATFGTSISTIATGGGTIVLEPMMKVYPYGTVVRVLAVPNPGFGLSLWGGAGAGQTHSEWSLTVTNATPKISALFGPVLKPCP